MKQRTPYFLAASLIVAASCQAEERAAGDLSFASRSRRDLQDVPVVGIMPFPTSITFDTDIDVMVAADDQLDVTRVEIGELICESLADVIDAPVLQFAVTGSEVITAEMTSFTEVGSDGIEDGTGRMTWTGAVIESELADDEVSRTVTLTFSAECKAETFLMTVTTEFADGTTSVLRSVPCDVGGTADLCLVEAMIDFLPVGDPEVLLPPPSDFSDEVATIPDSIDVGGRRLRAADFKRRTSKAVRQEGRELQENTIITVMFLFTPEAQMILGGVTASQIVSFILAGLALTNDAFTYSEIALQFELVAVGVAPFVQPVSSVDALIELTFNPDVKELRHIFDADLVQLVGGFSDLCSLGWQFPGGCDFQFSVASPNCFAGFSHTNAFGRNLGCFADRGSSPVQTPFSHGLQVCAAGFHTIMSVPCEDPPGSVRINHFSNPDVSFLTFPTGTDTEDNARQIETVMDLIAACKPVDDLTPPPTPSEPEFEFLECYRDSQASRVLSGAFEKGNPLMTAEVCAAFCPGAPFFGTEFGNECFCGVEGDTPAELGPATCDIPCAGDPEEICGGRDAISVYAFTQ